MLTIMILITSGLGFIGSHTTDAFLEAGHDVVATTHSDRRPAAFLRERPQLTVARLDVLNRRDWDDLGRRFAVDSIVHLATVHGSGQPADAVAADLQGFANVLQFAADAGVRRVAYASSIGVYAGVEPPYREDAPLPPVAPHGIAAAKKSLELVADLARQAGGSQPVGLRIGGAWGPLGNPTSRFIGLPRLLHAGVSGTPLQLDADIACDLIHVDDLARAIVALVTATTLNHPIYNVGSGQAISDREVAATIRRLLPGAAVSVAESAPRYEVGPLDVSRLVADTAFRPRTSLSDGLRSYADWLREADR